MKNMSNIYIYIYIYIYQCERKEYAQLIHTLSKLPRKEDNI